MSKEMCAICERIFETDSANRFCCDKCLKEIQSRSAKRRGLNQIGINAQMKKRYDESRKEQC